MCYLLVLGRVLWQNQKATCTLALFKGRGGGILVFTFLWLEALGECCPNFDTLALFKRRENATQILIFMLWLGHQKEPKSHQNPPQIDNKSSKLVLGMTLGTPGLPLEASWAPLGAPTPKTMKKVTWWTPPQGGILSSNVTLFGKKSVLVRLFRRSVFCIVFL